MPLGKDVSQVGLEGRMNVGVADLEKGCGARRDEDEAEAVGSGETGNVSLKVRRRCDVTVARKSIEIDRGELARLVGDDDTLQVVHGDAGRAIGTGGHLNNELACVFLLERHEQLPEGSLLLLAFEHEHRHQHLSITAKTENDRNAGLVPPTRLHKDALRANEVNHPGRSVLEPNWNLLWSEM